MMLHTSVRQGCLVVEMPPEVDIGNAEPLRWELGEMCRTRLDRAARDGVSAVVVDWAAAPFLTMAGVAVLDDLRQRLVERGVAVRVVASRRVVRAVLRIVGLADVLAIHDTVEQALTAGKASGEGRGRPEMGKSS
ncbi:STAS domain-containing protein [Streptomyces sp. NPDC055243]|uniref:STAS domain-containing protein n=1 Tax=Streptomyces sp. NPDC055243 TaxID=3365720 RepID=UPI0037D1ADE5